MDTSASDWIIRGKFPGSSGPISGKDQARLVNYILEEFGPKLKFLRSFPTTLKLLAEKEKWNHSRTHQQGKLDIEFIRFPVRWMETGVKKPTPDSLDHKDESGTFISSREIVLTTEGELYQLILIKYGAGTGNPVTWQYFDEIHNYGYLRVNVYSIYDDLLADLLEGTEWTTHLILELATLYRHTLKHQQEILRRNQSSCDRIEQIFTRHQAITTGKG